MCVQQDWNPLLRCTNLNCTNLRSIFSHPVRYLFLFFSKLSFIDSGLKFCSWQTRASQSYFHLWNDLVTKITKYIWQRHKSKLTSYYFRIKLLYVVIHCRSKWWLSRNICNTWNVYVQLFWREKMSMYIPVMMRNWYYIVQRLFWSSDSTCQASFAIQQIWYKNFYYLSICLLTLGISHLLGIHDCPML